MALNIHKYKHKKQNVTYVAHLFLLVAHFFSRRVPCIHVHVLQPPVVLLSCMRHYHDRSYRDLPIGIHSFPLYGPAWILEV